MGQPAGRILNAALTHLWQFALVCLAYNHRIIRLFYLIADIPYSRTNRYICSGKLFVQLSSPD